MTCSTSGESHPNANIMRNDKPGRIQHNAPMLSVQKGKTQGHDFHSSTSKMIVNVSDDCFVAHDKTGMADEHTDEHGECAPPTAASTYTSRRAQPALAFITSTTAPRRSARGRRRVARWRGTATCHKCLHPRCYTGNSIAFNLVECTQV